MLNAGTSELLTSNVTGTITGGTVKDPQAAYLLDGATLDSVKFEGAIDIGGGQSTTIGNTTITGASGADPGTISVIDGSLFVAGSDDFATGTITLGNTSGLGGVIYLTTTPGTETESFTLGAQATLVTESASLIGDSSHSVTIVNKGQIDAAQQYTSLSITAGSGSFLNQSTISIANAASIGIVFDQAGTVTNTGAVQITGAQSNLIVGGYGVAAASFTNTGTIAITAGRYANLSTYTFRNTGIITANASSFGTEDGAAGYPALFGNTGTITVTNGGQAYLDAAETDNTGTLIATGAGSTLDLSGTFQNMGSIVLDGGTLSVNTTLITAMLDTITGQDAALIFNGQLDNTGATLSVGGAAIVQTFDFNFGTIEGGTVRETGAAFTLGSYETFDNVAFEGSLTIASGEQLADTGTQTGALTNSGQLSIGFPTPGGLTVQSFTSTGDLIVSSALTLTHGGTIGEVSNFGTIDALVGTTTFTQPLDGRGTLLIGAGAHVVFETGDVPTQTLNFATNGTLSLANPLDLLGTITGFGAGDQIALLATSATTLTYLAVRYPCMTAPRMSPP